MTEYDPEILQSFADDLYRRADLIVFGSILQWGAAGALIAFVAYAALPQLQREFNPWVLVGIAAVCFGAVGRNVGLRKSFSLRLEAQRTLCQLQIEKNTQKPS